MKGNTAGECNFSTFSKDKSILRETIILPKNKRIHLVLHCVLYTAGLGRQFLFVTRDMCTNSPRFS